MDDLPDIARQAIAAGLDLVRWDQETDGHNPTGVVLDGPEDLAP